MALVHFMLAFLAVGTAMSNGHFYAQDIQVFGKRQEYKPPPPRECLGPGDTCATACGAGSQLCSDGKTRLCYNPTLNDTCCQPGTSAAWSCFDGDYCLVNGYCCPKGIDPKLCARSFSVTLPATYVGPTYTSALTSRSVPTSAVTSRSVTTSAQVISDSESTIPSITTIESSAPSSSTKSSTSSRTTSSTSVVALTGAASHNALIGRIGLIYGLLALIENLF